ncbi:TRAM domain-containing protein, partial [Tsukamurella tyrosinosolvens]
MLAPNDLLELTCGAPGHGGFVIARHDGRAIFVRGALPGERVRARVTEVKKSYARASTVDVLEASPHRVPEACAAAAAGAGCCDLTFADPAYQRELKADVLHDLLVRFGGFEPDAFEPTV